MKGHMKVVGTFPSGQEYLFEMELDDDVSNETIGDLVGSSLTFVLNNPPAKPDNG